LHIDYSNIWYSLQAPVQKYWHQLLKMIEEGTLTPDMASLFPPSPSLPAYLLHLTFKTSPALHLLKRACFPLPGCHSSSRQTIFSVLVNEKVLLNLMPWLLSMQVITHEFPLTSAPEAYKIFNEKQDFVIKVVMDPWATA
jgi:hypothetical protein